MSEIAKTLIFVAAGLVAVGSAYFIDTRPTTEEAADAVGQTLNSDFDVDKPKRMRISKFNPSTATTRQFEVASVDGIWSIPSKQNYPADAAEQMAKAATALIDRQVLRVAANDADAHAEFGVVDPLAANLDSNSQGVGTRVQMYDADDASLVDMVIGKKVKDADNQRYVRKPTQNVVYIVELDPSSLSTNFDDWIEDDLLKLNPFDVNQVFINDYSLALSLGITSDGRPAFIPKWDRRNQMTFRYDSQDAKWHVVDLKKFDPTQDSPIQDPQPDEPAADEEVNQESLSTLRTALDDLTIVDVARKPEGLSADLKAGADFLAKPEAGEDLMAKGFAPISVGGDTEEILSSEGEAIVTLRDGVEYVLRFGKLQVQTDGAEVEQAAEEEDESTEETDDPTAAAKETADAAKSDKLHRYLFVMARFNEGAIAKPELKELPPLPEGAEETPSAEATEQPAAGGDQPKAADQPVADAATDETEPAADNEDAASAAEGTPAEETTADEKPTEEKSEADKKAEIDAAIAKRKAVEEENKLAEEQYQKSIEAGKKKVEELNERFGDWYYVISDDVYKQIHLNRSQVIKKKGAEADGAAAPAAGNPLQGLPGLPSLPSANPATPPAVEAPKEETPAAEPSNTGEEPASAAPAEPSAETDATTAPAAEAAKED